MPAGMRLAAPTTLRLHTQSFMSFLFHALQDREEADSDDALLRLAGTVALAGLLALAWTACAAKHRHRRVSQSPRAPASVHRWEGEGGRPLPAEHEASTSAKAKPV
jgi:hypothetical protein